MMAALVSNELNAPIHVKSIKYYQDWNTHFPLWLNQLIYWLFYNDMTLLRNLLKLTTLRVKESSPKFASDIKRIYFYSPWNNHKMISQGIEVGLNSFNVRNEVWRWSLKRIPICPTLMVAGVFGSVIRNCRWPKAPIAT